MAWTGNINMKVVGVKVVYNVRKQVSTRENVGTQKRVSD